MLDFIPRTQNDRIALEIIEQLTQINNKLDLLIPKEEVIKPKRKKSE